MSGLFPLLRQRRFAPFFLTQFLGAFNDNLFKNALVVLLTFRTAQWTTLKPELLANLAAGLFILPFFLFSASAGQLADKYDKAVLTRWVKVLEMLIMGIAAIGFLLHSLALLLAALFLLGLHSTLFGPIKYAILPQHLQAQELLGGNALIESATFVAILAGTLAGSLLAGSVEDPWWIAAAGLIVAGAGYLASRSVPAAPPPMPQLAISGNPLAETWRNIAFTRRQAGIFPIILAISWFWLYGALFLAQFPVYARTVLGGGESSVSLLLAIFTIGIGLGSILCERLSRRGMELGLVPLGSLGLSLFALDLCFATPTASNTSEVLSLGVLLTQGSVWRILADLLLLGMAGGLFTVPLYALLQLRSDAGHRARIIAANNIVNALYMVVGALAAAALLDAGLSIPALFGVAASINAALALVFCRQLPEFPQRFLAWLRLH